MSIWKTIQSSIQSSGYPDFIIDRRQSVSGGDISQAFLVSDNQNSFFVKLNVASFFNNFQQESIGLDFLSRCEKFVVPKVVTLGRTGKSSFLVLEYITMNDNGAIFKFAEALASLHQLTNNRFGFESNNYIGASPQLNTWSTNWAKFFVEYRLLPQFNALFQIYAEQAVVKKIESDSNLLMSLCLDYLNSHSPNVSLVHGDLWQGNYGFSNSGKPVIYDPACYYGDREVDIAMLELFGRPSQAFYASYYSIFPKKEGDELRKRIYNLYHLLNHANLFGLSYLAEIRASIDFVFKIL